MHYSIHKTTSLEGGYGPVFAFDEKSAYWISAHKDRIFLWEKYTLIKELNLERPSLEPVFFHNGIILTHFSKYNSKTGPIHFENAGTKALQSEKGLPGNKRNWRLDTVYWENEDILYIHMNYSVLRTDPPDLPKPSIRSCIIKYDTRNEKSDQIWSGGIGDSINSISFQHEGVLLWGSNCFIYRKPELKPLNWGIDGGIRSLKFSTDGQLIAILFINNHLILVDGVNFLKIAECRPSTTLNQIIGIHPKLSVICSCDEQNNIYLWTQEHENLKLCGHSQTNDWIEGAAMNNQGTMFLALSGTTERIEIWEIQ